MDLSDGRGRRADHWRDELGSGALLATPLFWLASWAVGLSFLAYPLDWVCSFSGVVIWLALVGLLSALASYLQPAALPG